MNILFLKFPAHSRFYGSASRNGSLRTYSTNLKWASKYEKMVNNCMNDLELLRKMNDHSTVISSLINSAEKVRNTLYELKEQEKHNRKLTLPKWAHTDYAEALYNWGTITEQVKNNFELEKPCKDTITRVTGFIDDIYNDVIVPSKEC